MEAVFDQQNCQKGILRLWVRGCLFLAGLILLGMLVVASRLTPSQAGMGTHQQLGLPPCSLVLIAGIRCPACGMTTSWAHLMHGNLVASVQANSGGALLGLLALVFVPWSWASAWQGKWWLTAPHETYLLVISITIAVVVCLEWVCRMSGWR